MDLNCPDIYPKNLANSNARLVLCCALVNRPWHERSLSSKFWCRHGRYTNRHINSIGRKHADRLGHKLTLISQNLQLQRINSLESLSLMQTCSLFGTSPSPPLYKMPGPIEAAQIRILSSFGL